MDLNQEIRVKECRLVPLANFKDERGELSVCNIHGSLPFEVRRVFWTYNINNGMERANHAHKSSHEVVFPLGGSWKVELDDGTDRQILHMDDASVGIYIPPMVWCRIFDFSEGAACLSLASDEYTPQDYINDYDEFLAVTQQGE